MIIYTSYFIFYIEEYYKRKCIKYMLENKLSQIEKQYPKNDKKESNNPLSFGDKISNWTVLYRTNNTKDNHI